MTCGGQTYRTVRIDDQVWMAENLNYRGTEPDTLGNCYDNEAANCEIYGRLYDWATAMGIDAKYNSQEWGGSDVKHRGICPDGWHIPNNAEWDRLYRYVDGSDGTDSLYSSRTAGTKLKSASHWESYDVPVPVGTDEYGFSALPGGNGNLGFFYSVGFNGSWWTSYNYNDYAYERYVSYNREQAGYGGSSKSTLYSVRCVMD